ncbi:LysR family transcriptional regulator [Streptomyces microflavus]|uniref:LysR family transcriptional regulator n=1 Tax=Streptomyces microflavus TaxID=1919 RepID=UPI0036820523
MRCKRRPGAWTGSIEKCGILGITVGMKTEMRHLRIFVTIVNEGSMVRAAQRLGLTQPSITRAMQELEQRLSVTLLTRAGRGAAPTAVGRKFADTARQLLKAFDSALDAPGQTPPLLIAYAWSGLIPAMEMLLRTWRAQNLRQDIELARMPTPVMALDTAIADLALVREWTANPRYKDLRINREPRVVAVSAADPLASRDAVSFADLAPYGLVRPSHGSTTPHHLWGHPHNSGRDRIANDVEDCITTIATTQAVFGITPASTADFYRHSAIVYIPLRQAPTVVTSLIWSASGRPEVDEFVEHARGTLCPVTEKISAPKNPRVKASARQPICC